MLRITNLVLARAAKRLFEAANLTVHAGHKVGLVGANGSGKSSLFAAILGEVLPEAGAIDLPSAWTIAHVAQETPAVARPALAYVLDGDRELREVESALARVENDPAHDGAALAALHHHFDAIGGYSARPRAAALLAGLGFAEPRQMDSVESFSGGWRMRLNLAQALMCRSPMRGATPARARVRARTARSFPSTTSVPGRSHVRSCRPRRRENRGHA